MINIINGFLQALYNEIIIEPIKLTHIGIPHATFFFSAKYALNVPFCDDETIHVILFHIGFKFLLSLSIIFSRRA